jgi:hypothetical protein
VSNPLPYCWRLADAVDQLQRGCQLCPS